MRVCILICCETRSYALFVHAKRNRYDYTFSSNPAELNVSSCDHILFTGFFPTVITRNIEISRQVGRKELTGSIQYKFAQNLPVDSGDIRWEYRILNAKNKNSDYEIRAAAVGKNELSDQMELLRQNNIRIDQCILTPLLLADDLFPGISLYGPPLPETFADYIREHKAGEYENFTKQLEAEVPEAVRLSLFAAVCFLEKYNDPASIVSCDGMVPDDLRPVRYRSLKKVNLFLMIAALLFASLLLFERGKNSYAYYEKIEQENDVLREQLKELQVQNFHLSAKEKLLNEYRDLKAGRAGLETALLEIAQKTPSYMWIKSFRLSGDAVEMTLESSRDDINFYNTMKTGKSYELKNLRKNKGRGDGIDYSLTLELVQP